MAIWHQRSVTVVVCCESPPPVCGPAAWLRQGGNRITSRTWLARRWGRSVPMLHGTLLAYTTRFVMPKLLAFILFPGRQVLWPCPRYSRQLRAPWPSWPSHSGQTSWPPPPPPFPSPGPSLLLVPDGPAPHRACEPCSSFASANPLELLHPGLGLFHHAAFDLAVMFPKLVHIYQGPLGVPRYCLSMSNPDFSLRGRPAFFWCNGEYILFFFPPRDRSCRPLPARHLAPRLFAVTRCNGAVATRIHRPWPATPDMLRRMPQVPPSVPLPTPTRTGPRSPTWPSVVEFKTALPR